MARKILLADDSVTAQNMGRRILTDAGYEVITVNNGSAAIKKINEIKPDLIVLDIYMPGYGGLEICQSIRETPELARIPVLLTVGKLEPFKADDAKRVRADAFVIKPFEASELLTALAKLEDKIVPSGQSFSGGSFTGGRFARAVASLEEMKAAKEFGDTDTGWKSRLKIPAPYSKPHEAHVESQASAPDAHHVPAAVHEHRIEKVPERETENVASILPEAVASALPHNVTPEEIEAIAAAAAMLASHADISADAPLGSHRHADVKEQASADSTTPATSVHDSVENDSEEVESIRLASRTPERAESSSEIADAATAGEGEKSCEISGIQTPPAPQPVQTAQEVRADEVTAMLASLSPMLEKPRVAEVDEPVPVTMAAAVGEYSGPRWTAEETSVSEEESTLVLQLEMERAFAAFAAADAARSFHVEHFRESSAASYMENRRQTREGADTESLATARADISAVENEPAAAPPATVESHSEEADSSAQERVRNDKVEADPSAQEQVRNDSVTDHAGMSVSADAVEVRSTEAAEDIAPAQEEKAAYAVASAGWGAAAGSSPTENIAQNPIAEVSSALPASDPTVENRNNELAAAWASWKQVRESEAGPQANAETVGQAGNPKAESAAEVHASQNEDSLETDDAEASEAEASAQAAEDASEVASIVESVLADLKPKLMKEIAQKMGKGKKKKKKND